MVIASRRHQPPAQDRRSKQSFVAVYERLWDLRHPDTAGGIWRSSVRRALRERPADCTALPGACQAKAGCGRGPSPTRCLTRIVAHRARARVRLFGGQRRCGLWRSRSHWRRGRDGKNPPLIRCRTDRARERPGPSSPPGTSSQSSLSPLRRRKSACTLAPAHKQAAERATHRCKDRVLARARPPGRPRRPSLPLCRGT